MATFEQSNSPLKTGPHISLDITDVDMKTPSLEIQRIEGKNLTCSDLSKIATCTCNALVTCHPGPCRDLTKFSQGNMWF